MNFTFIYPNQLFDIHPCVNRKRKILLIQDPLFFGDQKYAMKFHKQKILLHSMSMNYYKNKINQNGFSVEIVPYSDLLNKKDYNSWIFKKYKVNEVHIVDVVDYELKDRIVKSSSLNRVEVFWHENPNFFLNSSDVSAEFKEKKFNSMQIFYKKQRRRFNILIENDEKPTGGHWSFDKENRKKLPINISLPKDYKFSYDSKIHLKAEKFIQDYFPDNYGTTSEFNYPINHEQAEKSFDDFLENKFSLFGPYEDAISNIDSTLFHSVLTPYLNIGLISPKVVISKSLEFAKDKKIPINSLEGFIRQIIGWREFIRGIYETNGATQRTKNFWNYDKTIPDSFYTANTEMEPVDNCIARLLRKAYLHHIERLMVLGNIFCLLRINPDQVYKWFMELFIDAYDWVMVPNVYGMSQFSDGGIMATKPYISGSNYILKMSRYKKGNWSQIWDALYWNFINENRTFFKKNPRMSMMVNLYDKKPNDLKLSYLEIEKSFHIN